MLLRLKENQGRMYAAVQRWFDQENGAATYQETVKGQGRLVTYRIQTTDALNDYFKTDLAWPWLGQAFRIERRCVYPKTGQVLEKVHFGLTDLSRQAASPQTLLHDWHQHWHVENKDHWVLDTVFGEDRSTVRKDHAPAAFSFLRNTALSVLRLFGPPGITQARTEFSANVGSACSLIGIL